MRSVFCLRRASFNACRLPAPVENRVVYTENRYKHTENRYKHTENRYKHTENRISSLKNRTTHTQHYRTFLSDSVLVPEEEQKSVRVAIVGSPNVGTFSLQIDAGSLQWALQMQVRFLYRQMLGRYSGLSKCRYVFFTDRCWVAIVDSPNVGTFSLQIDAGSLQWTLQMQVRFLYRQMLGRYSGLSKCRYVFFADRCWVAIVGSPNVGTFSLQIDAGSLQWALQMQVRFLYRQMLGRYSGLSKCRYVFFTDRCWVAIVGSPNVGTFSLQIDAGSLQWALQMQVRFLYRQMLGRYSGLSKCRYVFFTDRCWVAIVGSPNVGTFSLQIDAGSLQWALQMQVRFLYRQMLGRYSGLSKCRYVFFTDRCWVSIVDSPNVGTFSLQIDAGSLQWALQMQVRFLYRQMLGRYSGLSKCRYVFFTDRCWVAIVGSPNVGTFSLQIDAGSLQWALQMQVRFLYRQMRGRYSGLSKCRYVFFTDRCWVAIVGSPNVGTFSLQIDAGSLQWALQMQVRFLYRQMLGRYSGLSKCRYVFFTDRCWVAIVGSPNVGTFSLQIDAGSLQWALQMQVRFLYRQMLVRYSGLSKCRYVFFTDRCWVAIVDSPNVGTFSLQVDAGSLQWALQMQVRFLYRQMLGRYSGLSKCRYVFFTDRCWVAIVGSPNVGTFSLQIDAGSLQWALQMQVRFLYRQMLGRYSGLSKCRYVFFTDRCWVAIVGSPNVGTFSLQIDAGSLQWTLQMQVRFLYRQMLGRYSGLSKCRYVFFTDRCWVAIVGSPNVGTFSLQIDAGSLQWALQMQVRFLYRQMLGRYSGLSKCRYVFFTGRCWVAIVGSPNVGTFSLQVDAGSLQWALQMQVRFLYRQMRGRYSGLSKCRYVFFTGRCWVAIVGSPNVGTFSLQIDAGSLQWALQMQVRFLYRQMLGRYSGLSKCRYVFFTDRCWVAIVGSPNVGTFSLQVDAGSLQWALQMQVRFLYRQMLGRYSGLSKCRYVFFTGRCWVAIVGSPNVGTFSLQVDAGSLQWALQMQVRFLYRQMLGRYSGLSKCRYVFFTGRCWVAIVDSPNVGTFSLQIDAGSLQWALQMQVRFLYRQMLGRYSGLSKCRYVFFTDRCWVAIVGSPNVGTFSLQIDAGSLQWALQMQALFLYRQMLGRYSGLSKCRYVFFTDRCWVAIVGSPNVGTFSLQIDAGSLQWALQMQVRFLYRQMLGRYSGLSKCRYVFFTDRCWVAIVGSLNVGTFSLQIDAGSLQWALQMQARFLYRQMLGRYSGLSKCRHVFFTDRCWVAIVGSPNVGTFSLQIDAGSLQWALQMQVRFLYRQMLGRYSGLSKCRHVFFTDRCWVAIVGSPNVSMFSLQIDAGSLQWALQMQVRFLYRQMLGRYSGLSKCRYVFFTERCWVAIVGSPNVGTFSLQIDAGSLQWALQMQVRFLYRQMLGRYSGLSKCRYVFFTGRCWVAIVDSPNVGTFSLQIDAGSLQWTLQMQVRFLYRQMLGRYSGLSKCRYVFFTDRCWVAIVGSPNVGTFSLQIDAGSLQWTLQMQVRFLYRQMLGRYSGLSKCRYVFFTGRCWVAIVDSPNVGTFSLQIDAGSLQWTLQMQVRFLYRQMLGRYSGLSKCRYVFFTDRCWVAIVGSPNVGTFSLQIDAGSLQWTLQMQVRFLYRQMLGRYSGLSKCRYVFFTDRCWVAIVGSPNVGTFSLQVDAGSLQWALQMQVRFLYRLMLGRYSGLSKCRYVFFTDRCWVAIVGSPNVGTFSLQIDAGSLQWALQMQVRFLYRQMLGRYSGLSKCRYVFFTDRCWVAIVGSPNVGTFSLQIDAGSLQWALQMQVRFLYRQMLGRYSGLSKCRYVFFTDRCWVAIVGSPNVGTFSLQIDAGSLQWALQMQVRFLYRQMLGRYSGLSKCRYVFFTDRCWVAIVGSPNVGTFSLQIDAGSLQWALQMQVRFLYRQMLGRYSGLSKCRYVFFTDRCWVAIVGSPNVGTFSLQIDAGSLQWALQMQVRFLYRQMLGRYSGLSKCRYVFFTDRCWVAIVDSPNVGTFSLQIDAGSLQWALQMQVRFLYRQMLGRYSGLSKCRYVFFTDRCWVAIVGSPNVGTFSLQIDAGSLQWALQMQVRFLYRQMLGRYSGLSKCRYVFFTDRCWVAIVGSPNVGTFSLQIDAGSLQWALQMQVRFLYRQMLGRYSGLSKCRYVFFTDRCWVAIVGSPNVGTFSLQIDAGSLQWALQMQVRFLYRQMLGRYSGLSKCMYVFFTDRCWVAIVDSPNVGTFSLQIDAGSLQWTLQMQVRFLYRQMLGRYSGLSKCRYVFFTGRCWVAIVGSPNVGTFSLQVDAGSLQWALQMQVRFLYRQMLGRYSGLSKCRYVFFTDRCWVAIVGSPNVGTFSLQIDAGSLQWALQMQARFLYRQMLGRYSGLSKCRYVFFTDRCWVAIVGSPNVGTFSLQVDAGSLQWTLQMQVRFLYRQMLGRYSGLSKCRYVFFTDRCWVAIVGSPNVGTFSLQIDAGSLQWALQMQVRFLYRQMLGRYSGLSRCRYVFFTGRCWVAIVDSPNVGTFSLQIDAGSLQWALQMQVRFLYRQMLGRYSGLSKCRYVFFTDRCWVAIVGSPNVGTFSLQIDAGSLQWTLQMQVRFLYRQMLGRYSGLSKCRYVFFTDRCQVAMVTLYVTGKSTLLNSLMQQYISPVSRMRNTTWSNVSGVITQDDIQVIFIDTPGWECFLLINSILFLFVQ